MPIIPPNLTKVYIPAVNRRNKYNSQEKMLIYIESLEITGVRGEGTKTLKKENENVIDMQSTVILTLLNSGSPLKFNVSMP